MKKFEFLLKINSNIICQRYFSMKNFNPKSVNSREMLECVNDCVEIVQKQLKEFGYHLLTDGYFGVKTKAVIIAFKRHFLQDDVSHYWHRRAEATLLSLLEQVGSKKDKKRWHAFPFF